jgi:hypothetical protein
VAETCNPSVAKKLKALGISYVRDNLPIIDSYFPPDFCRAFTPDKKCIKSGDVTWPNKKITALIRIHNEKQGGRPESAKESYENDKWLL